MEASAAVDLETAQAQTALSVAAWNGQAKAVTKLARLGADLNYECKDGTTALGQVRIRTCIRSDDIMLV